MEAVRPITATCHLSFPSFFFQFHSLLFCSFHFFLSIFLSYDVVRFFFSFLFLCSTYQFWTKITSQPWRIFRSTRSTLSMWFFFQIYLLFFFLYVSKHVFSIFFFLFSNYWCLFICNAKWSLREKDLSQWTHLKGLTPVCFLWCLVSSSDRAKRHSQPSHEQRYGFSPRKKIEFGIKMHYRKSWYL